MVGERSLNTANLKENRMEEQFPGTRSLEGVSLKTLFDEVLGSGR